MGFWVLVQVLCNLFLFGALAVVWVRLSRPAKDDPRLSKGLQLLQSKISVLEDLSDRTETQVSQLTAILEGKCREIQEKIVAADKQISRIDISAQKSLEVASIFQDRIPHSEILERQNTIKYVTAARMAHRGCDPDEIAKKVDLSRAEIEFIAKVNRENLQFSEDDLPEWARVTPEEIAPTSSVEGLNFSLPRENFQATTPTMQAQPEPIAKPSTAPTQSFLEIDLRGPEPTAPETKVTKPAPAAEPPPIRAQTASGKSVEVRPVNFPRITT